MDNSSDTNNSSIKRLLIAGLVLLLFSSAIIATIYTTSIKQHDPNKKSTNRMQQLNEILSGLLGRNWPYLLMFIIVLLMVLTMLLYSKATDNSPIFNLSDNASKVLMWCTIILTVFISLAIIGLFINMYLSPKDDIPNYTPDETNKTQILMIGGLCIVLLLVIIGVFAFLRKVFKK